MTEEPDRSDPSTEQILQLAQQAVDQLHRILAVIVATARILSAPTVVLCNKLGTDPAGTMRAFEENHFRLNLYTNTPTRREGGGVRC